MSKSSIHHLLHGYKSGHQLLAGSVRLSAEAADLVARLSDLSGALVPGAPPPPYLSLYPLPEGGYHAAARTWLDESAPRAGCVLTHTLLIPDSVWRSCRNPRAFESLFINGPPAQDAKRFQTPLEPPADVNAAPAPLGRPPAQAQQFVAKFFGDGVRPVVWFDCPEPDRVLWNVIQSAWPSLRSRFAACTYSLQARTLEDGPFHLLFAPGASYPRFQDSTRTAFVRDAATAGGSSAAIEPWVKEYASTVFEGRPSSIAAEMEAFQGALPCEPSVVRTLFLITSLRSRLETSATAGVGLLDAVEAVAAAGTESVEAKRRAVGDAITAAKTAEPAAALRCLSLIAERLAHPAYSLARAAADKPLSRSVAHLASDHLAEALRAPGARLVTEPDDSPYFVGLLDAMEESATASPRSLLALKEYPGTAERAVKQRPPIGAGLVLGAKGAERSTVDSLAQWVRGVEDPTTVRALRYAILPAVDNDEEAPLASALLDSAPADEAIEWLETLNRTTAGFGTPGLKAVVRNSVAGRHPRETRRWVTRASTWGEGAAEVAAAAYPSGSDGLEEAIEHDASPLDRRALIASFLLAPNDHEPLPDWLGIHARSNCAFLVPLISLGSRAPERVSRVIERCLRDLPELPLARCPELSDLVEGASATSYGSQLVDRLMRSAIPEYVAGGVSFERVRSWQNSHWAESWLINAARGELPNIVASSAFASQETWERAWAWLAHAPRTVYEHGPGTVEQLTGWLVTSETGNWTVETGAAWATVVRRARTECDNSTSLRLAVAAVQHCFSRGYHPFGRVVSAAFPIIYAAVAESRWTPEAAGLFGFFDWDRAKELRKRLIDAFVNSSWEPGDLAIAADGEPLLRKIFKRLKRKYDNGDSYVAAMQENLAHRSDHGALEARDTLSRLCEDPNFYEAWD